MQIRASNAERRSLEDIAKPLTATGSDSANEPDGTQAAAGAASAS